MNSIKKLLIIMLSIIITFGSSAPSFAAVKTKEELQKEHFNVNKNAKPHFIIDGDSIFGPINAKGLQTLTIRLKNNSSHEAKEIYASISPSGADSQNLILPQGAELNSKSNTTVFGNGKIDFNFKFYVNPRAISKPYKLDLKLRYRNFVGTEFEGSIPIFVRVENRAIIPSISVMEYEVENGLVTSKKPSDIRIRLKNDSGETMKNVTTQILDMSADGIELHNDSEYKHIGDMAKGTDIYIRYKLKASPAASGDKSIRVKINYFDEQGISYTKEWPLHIPVSARASISKDLKVKFLKDSYNILAGKTTTVTLVAKNKSKSEMNNVKMDISVEGGIKFLTPYRVIIDKLAPNEEKTFNFKLLADKSAEKGTYPISVNTSSLNSSESTIADISGIIVDKTGSSSKNSKPKIIINEYDYGSKYIMAGSEFDITVGFLNTSSHLSIKNVKVQMESEEGMFTPVDTTNSFFFKEIKPQESAKKTIRFKSKSDAKVKLYSLTFKLEYEDETGKAYDEKGNLFTSNEVVTINVKQEVRLEINEIKLPDSFSVGKKANLEVEYFNMGKSPLYNMIVKLEGDFDKTDSSNYVGNFEQAKSEYFSTSITPKKEGKNKGKLIFEFEDETGQKIKHEKEFEFNVNPASSQSPNEDNINMGGGKNPMDMYEQEEKSGGILGLLTSPITLGVLTLIAAIVTFIVIKKKKEKRMKELLEEEYED